MSNRNDFVIQHGVLAKYTGSGGDVVIPEGVTCIAKWAFSDVNNLTNITFPSSVTSIEEGAFDGCSSLTSVMLPDSITSIGRYAFQNCSRLTSITLPNSVNQIGWGAFKKCSNLTNITIPDGVTYIAPWIFDNCSSLTSITIPNSVTKIGNSAFENCSSLTSITIPDSVTKICSCAFENCSSLTNITIPDSVAGIDYKAFAGTAYYKNPSNWKNGFLYIGNHLIQADRNVLTGNYDIKNGTICIGTSAFGDCRMLSGITIPEGAKSIGNSAFSGCNRLTSVTIPDSVTNIGSSAFEGCNSLRDITIPNGVTKIDSSTFRKCTYLENITIPDGATSIGEWAFQECRFLKNIVIPDSVTSIGELAFDECYGITNVTWPSALAKELQHHIGKQCDLHILHIADISNVSAKFRPAAAVGFAEDERDCTDENGKKYLKYIKSNAAKLVEYAIAHPALLHLMLQEKLIAAKDLEAVTNAVQQTGDTELIAAILDYGNSSVSAKDKAKAQQKKDERETNVTNFIFDAEKLEALTGKTFVVTGKLKTFVSRDELKECLATCGATLTENLAEGVDYLITNTPNSGTAKNKKAVELGIRRITEAEFNKMIGRKVQ